MNEFVVGTPFDVSWDVPGIRVSKVPAASYSLIPDPEGALRDNFASKLAMTEDHVEKEFSRGWADAARGSIQTDGAPDRRSAHTCNWLYKNMVMDANGRILPCCGAPRPDVHLVFAKFPAETDCFNSGDYQRVRSYFANGSVATPSGPFALAESVPHCENCKWDHSHTEFGAGEVALYLRAAGLAPAAIEILADW